MAIDAVPVQRALAGTAVTLTYQHRASNGEPGTPGGTPTVAVTDSSGGTVTAGSVSDDGGGSYSSVVAAAESPQTELWTVTWTADSVGHSSLVAIVGNIYFDSAEIRDLEPTLNDAGKYPVADLLAKRDIVEFEAERITNRAFVPRFSVAELHWSGTDLVLPEWDVQEVRWVSTVESDGTLTAWTAEELAGVHINGSSGTLSPGRRLWSRVRIGYEFGLDFPPSDIKQAAAKRLRWFANRPASTIPDRATSYSVDGGTYRIQTANRDRTGDDDVDAVYQSWARRDVGVA